MLHEIQPRPSRGFTGRGLPATQALPSKALRDGLRLTEGGHRLRDRLRFCTPCMGLGYHGVMYQRASASRCPRRGGGLEEHCRGCGAAAKSRLNAKLLGAKFCCANCRRPTRSDLLEIIDDRAGTRATIVTSQLPVEHWHAWIGDATIADAILDRLLSRSQRLALKGKSLRAGKQASPTSPVTFAEIRTCSTTLFRVSIPLGVSDLLAHAHAADTLAMLQALIPPALQTSPADDSVLVSRAMATLPA